LTLFWHQLNHPQKKFISVPEIGSDVEGKNLPDTTLESPSSKPTNPDSNTDVGPHDLPKMVRLEYDSIRVEV